MLDIHADVWPMEKWTRDQWDAFHPVCDALSAHGYWISTTPLEGQFDFWIADKKKALDIILKAAEFERKTSGFRGLSKNLIAAIHGTHPEPVWGVEVKPSCR